MTDLRAVARELIDAHDAHQTAEAEALGRAFRDAPDSDEAMVEMGQAAKRLDRAWDALREAVA